ncbi:MAG: hypothetical protein ACK41S_06630 [Planctomycetota bacterium]
MTCRISFPIDDPKQDQDASEKLKSSFWLDQEAAEMFMSILGLTEGDDFVHVLRWRGFQNCKIQGEVRLPRNDGVGSQPTDFSIISKMLKLDSNPNLKEFSGWLIITAKKLRDRNDNAYEIEIRGRLRTNELQKDQTNSSSGIGLPVSKHLLELPPSTKKTEFELGPTFSVAESNGLLKLFAAPSRDELSLMEPWFVFEILPVKLD